MSADRDRRRSKAVGELVAHYQAKARAVGRLGVAIGAIGRCRSSARCRSARSAPPGRSLANYGFATILGGLFVGVMIGYVIGDGRAQIYHRMAEQARLQLQLEERVSENDTRMAQLLTALTARAPQPCRHRQRRTAAAASGRSAQPQPVAAAPHPYLRTVAVTGIPRRHRCRRRSSGRPRS